MEPAMECEFPPGAAGDGLEHCILANPLRDLVGLQADRGHQLFQRYRQKHGKEYSSEKELALRAHAFIHNMRYVHSKNRANLPYKLALNHLADRTPEETAVLRGRQKDQPPSNGQPFPWASYAGLNLPESLDWRLFGAVTPMKDQALCGSCWSFAATGGLEGALFLKVLLVDPCSPAAPPRAVQWPTMGVGVPGWWWDEGAACGTSCTDPSAQPPPCASSPPAGPCPRPFPHGCELLWLNGYCHSSSSKRLANITGYVSIPAGNVTALKAAVFKNGPVPVNIDASAKSFLFYSNGIYYEPGCGNTTLSLNHAVLAVGYGVLQGESYWLIKNSWSTYWGNDGYILMSMRDNNCGVATAATYPILA